jgi:hypothetical protein
MPEGYNLLLEKAKQAGQLDNSGDDPAPTPGPDTPEPPNEGVILTGRVVSADTGDPIEGAFVLVFRLGITIKEANDRQDPADIYSFGQTDSRGEFILNNPVARNQAYSLVAYANGYATMGADDLVLATDADPATKDIGIVELPVAQ